MDFDAKDMMHTVRLLLSGRSLMQSGRPIVRFSGDQLDLLLSIREGRLSFEQIMSIAQAILGDCQRLKATAGLPDTCDSARANALLRMDHRTLGGANPLRDQVLRELSGIERQHNIRVLPAVESGSRAWGFASPDSDFDVRFVYAHDRDWFLSIFEQRDVIEEMLPERLDVSGWDLGKTLRLFSKCNLAVNEWIGSPIVYSEEPAFRHRLAALISRCFNPIKAVYHYRSMAGRAIAGNLLDGQIRIKKLFYVLRPLLACRWIEQTSTQRNSMTRRPANLPRHRSLGQVQADRQCYPMPECETPATRSLTAKVARSRPSRGCAYSTIDAFSSSIRRDSSSAPNACSISARCAKN